MAQRVITQHLYDSLLVAYRERPGNHSNAARVAGCERRMARRAFESGWERMPWAVPIKIVLDREQVTARAARHKDRSDEYELMAEAQKLAQQDAVDARTQEARLVKMSRGGALALLSHCIRALKATQPLLDQLETEVQSGELKAGGIIKLLDRVAHMTSQAVMLSKETMRMERLHLGEPEQIVSMRLDTVSTGDLVSELRSIESVLRSVKVEDAEIVDADHMLPQKTFSGGG